MSTDPKKNDEIKDEELEKVSGGKKVLDEQDPDSASAGTDRPLDPVKSRRQRH